MNSLGKLIDEVDETLELLQNFSISDRVTTRKTMDEEALNAILNAAVRQATEETRKELTN